MSADFLRRNLTSQKIIKIDRSASHFKALHSKENNYQNLNPRLPHVTTKKKEAMNVKESKGWGINEQRMEEIRLECPMALPGHTLMSLRLGILFSSVLA